MLYMYKISVDFVSKIPLMLIQSLYVVQYKRSTLASTYDFFVTTESYYCRNFTVVSFDHACSCSGMKFYYFLIDD